MQINFSDIPIRGIDISAYDLKLAFDKLVGRVHFIICRIGHGTKTDVKFKTFWGALKGKVFRSTYFYLDYYSNHFPNQAVFGIADYEWGVTQGNNAWNNLRDDNDHKVVYLDIENGDPSYAPEIDTVWNRVEVMADGFFDTYDKLSGATAGIYCSLSKLEQFSPRFRNRPLYLAWYDETQTRESVIKAVRERGWTGEIHFWQYSSDGDAGTDGKGDGLDFGLGRSVMDLDMWVGTEKEWDIFSKKVSGGQMNNILLNISPIAQRDPRWANIQLGTSNKTIGSHGCLISDATMFLRYLLASGVTPAELNAWLKKNDGYQNLNWFVWSVLEEYDSRISFGYRYNGPFLDKIDEQLEKKMPVMVNVDLIPATAVLDEHWVLVVGRIDGSYIINDPWYGAQLKFEDKYGDPRSGVKIISTYNFDGTVPPSIPIEPSEPEEVLFRVRIREGITKLTVRSEPIISWIYDTGLRAKFPEVYDIFEEKNEYGRIENNNWISIESQYVEKINTGNNLTLEEKVNILWEKYILLG